MIERLTSSLQALSMLGPDELVAPAQERLRGDCLDALRLELDCPQQALTPSQRAALRQLDAILDDPAASPSAVALAVRRAAEALR